MDIEQIRQARHAQPFRKFWIHLADGGRIPVEQGDSVALSPTGREIIVFLPDSSYQVINVKKITRLEIQAPPDSIEA
jgi:hypothetical protein